ncbi:DUF389 domain-containing protein [Membranihabitans maritimus]|uniref:DUF389 domain-containing protein n=1 Tax=Membranihabitans maritimus TaxID=2904244 RepID=UPI001F43F1CC|nr:DUF389 domain-containing protein [Membranihabitans maritimus]
MQTRQIIKTILNYFNLDSEIDDFERIHENILKDLEFKGTNLWILMFAIIVASVGLNMNSTAVVIGAMLISPLMGPINGMGYSVATYNFNLFRRSLKNYGFAVFASLIASTLYFSISPISTAHSELLARTSPTIYDVLIAFFGGLAGIVAITSKQKGNVIPGVAIATALMPPLCTAGYGLATGQFTFFFGALFLFTINTVFIALSSVLISQILKFPFRTLVNEERKKMVNRWISAVIIIILIPSIYFGYSLVQKEKFIENAELFIKSVDIIGGNYLLNQNIQPGKHEITLVYGGHSITDSDKSRIYQKAEDYGLDKNLIAIKEGFSFSEANSAMNENASLNEEIVRLKTVINNMEKARDSVLNRELMGQQLLSEINVLFPEVKYCSYSEAKGFNTGSDSPTLYSVLFLGSEQPLDPDSEQKLQQWITTRLETNNIKLIIQPINENDSKENSDL